MTKLNKNMPAKRRPGHLGGSAFGGDFKKDLLLVDLETTGLDAQKHEIIQIAAILLDRKTLKEKEAFSSYIKPAKWKKRDLESMKINGITWENLKSAPSLKEVLAQFSKLFKPSDVVLSYYGGPLDMDFLRAAYAEVGMKWRFDYHFFNLWGMFYAFLASRGQLKNPSRHAGFSLEDLMSKFKIRSKNRHDALEDCRIEAEILRKIIKSL